MESEVLQVIWNNISNSLNQMQFVLIFEKIFHLFAVLTRWNIFQDSKRNFVSPHGHVMFYLLYKHHWNTKPFHFNSFLVWKAQFIM